MLISSFIFFTLEHKKRRVLQNPPPLRIYQKIHRRLNRQMNYNTDETESQVKSIFARLTYQRQRNALVAEMFRKGNFLKPLSALNDCGTQIGILKENGVAKIVKANFCRQRVCYICSWRRQVRFTQTLRPIMNALNEAGYTFIFVTLTIRNVERPAVKQALDTLLSGYNRLLQRAEIKNAWSGVVRSVELTYNAEDNTYHPHLHMLVAVKQSYFKRSAGDYITHKRLTELWQDVCRLPYVPSCRIQTTTDSVAAAAETIKYALKPTEYIEAIEVFYNQLKGRRLVSFSGVFSEYKKLLCLPDFDTVLTDLPESSKLTYDVYKFDPTGGVYTFYKTFSLKE